VATPRLSAVRCVPLIGGQGQRFRISASERTGECAPDATRTSPLKYCDREVNSRQTYRKGVTEMFSTALLLTSLVAAPSPPIDLTDLPTPPDTATTRAPAPSVCVRSDGEEAGGDNSACTVSAYRVPNDAAPDLDGRLDESVWAAAQPATGFRQQEPTPNDPSSQRTEARVLYTDDAVYVGMRLFDDEHEQHDHDQLDH